MKNLVFRISALILISAGILFNIFASEASDGVLPVASDINFDELSAYENSQVQDIEKAIDKLVVKKRAEEEAQRLEEERIQSYENLEKQLASGKVTLRQLFSDAYFAGDSLMHGLNAYGVLDSAKMSTMVNASLYHLQNNISRIVSNNPKNLVLHYGINMLVNTDSALKSFIELYEQLINEFKEKLPDTGIFVSGIFNVSPKVQKQYSAIEKYNEALKEMCNRLSVKYVDNSPVLPGDGSYYGGDGIHLSKEFYSEIWLPHLFYVMNS